ncbi:MAG TPA: hypothetical protein VHM19_22840 [Polyangiales bacterium]|jgi:hypothetical protein|nr:hypothetical protein [Polyangiales bacterium]
MTTDAEAEQAAADDALAAATAAEDAAAAALELDWDPLEWVQLVDHAGAVNIFSGEVRPLDWYLRRRKALPEEFLRYHDRIARMFNAEQCLPVYTECFRRLLIALRGESSGAASIRDFTDELVALIARSKLSAGVETANRGDAPN